MNYLTNYYKNLCEQLQDQVNNLSSQLNMLNEMEGGLGSMETSEPIAGNQAGPAGGTVTTSDPAPPKPTRTRPVRQKGESQEQYQRALDRYAEQVRAYQEWLSRQRQTPSTPRNPTVPPKPANTPQQPTEPIFPNRPEPTAPKPIPRPRTPERFPKNPDFLNPRRPQPFNPNDVGPPAPVGPEVPETTPQVYPFPVKPINPFENRLMKNKGYR